MAKENQNVNGRHLEATQRSRDRLRTENDSWLGVCWEWAELVLSLKHAESSCAGNTAEVATELDIVSLK